MQVVRHASFVFAFVLGVCELSSVSTCRGGPRVAAPRPVQSPFPSSNEVNQIALYEMEDPFDGEILRPLGVVIDDEKTLGLAIAALKRGQSIDEAEVPFVGILCYEVFLDPTSNVLAITSIVNHDATVVFEAGALHDGAIRLSAIAGKKKRALRCVPFAQIVFDALLRDRPAYVRDQDEDYRRLAGKSLADLLGVTNRYQENTDNTSAISPEPDLLTIGGSRQSTNDAAGDGEQAPGSTHTTRGNQTPPDPE